MNKIKEFAGSLGLFVDTWNPDPGVSQLRYRFFTHKADYFESGSIFTAYGRKEAETFLIGVSVGRGISQ